MTKKILLATSNPGKAREIRTLLAEKLPDLEIITAGELPTTRGLDPEETGTTCRENAEIKALAFARASGLPTLADDTGLCVHCLGDFPGVKTARWRSGEQSERNLGLIELINHRLQNKPLELSTMVDFPPANNSLPVIDYVCPRGAHFMTALTFVDPTPNNNQNQPFVKTTLGTLPGQIVASPAEIRGQNGFGYDPIFSPDLYPDLTNAQLDPEVKNQISHRAQALAKMITFLTKYFA